MRELEWLVELKRIALYAAALEIVLAHLPAGDRRAVKRLLAMLPSRELEARLRAIDVAHLRVGDVGAGARAPDGRETVLQAQVLRTLRSLDGEL